MSVVKVRLTRWVEEYPTLKPGALYPVSVTVANHLRALGVLAGEQRPEPELRVHEVESDDVTD